MDARQIAIDACMSVIDSMKLFEDIRIDPIIWRGMLDKMTMAELDQQLLILVEGD